MSTSHVEFSLRLSRMESMILDLHVQLIGQPWPCSFSDPHGHSTGTDVHLGHAPYNSTKSSTGSFGEAQRSVVPLRLAPLLEDNGRTLNSEAGHDISATAPSRSQKRRMRDRRVKRTLWKASAPECQTPRSSVHSNTHMVDNL